MMVVTVLVIWCYVQLGTMTPASSTELQLTKDELVRRIEQLETQLDSANHKLDYVINDIDTLKKGQVIIFNEVKRSEKSFWDIFD